MKIFHISDLHYNPLDTLGCQNINKVFSDISKYKQQEDLLVVTGDIINRDYDDYSFIFNKLKETKLPFLCITGNHDTSSLLIQALKQYCPKHPQALFSDKLDYTCNDFPFKIIALDSFKENAPGGFVSDSQLQWLDKEISASTKPVVILIHQFCLDAKLAFFDIQTPQPWRGKFNKIVAQYPNKIKLILCGHVHNSLVGNINGIPMISSFSANWQANLDFAPLQDLKDSKRPVGYYIHNYIQEKFISYAVAL